MNKTLKIRFFGSGLILHTANFSLEWWELLLKKNRLKEEVFFDHLFMDDLFLQKTIIQPQTGLACCNYRDLLGPPRIHSPALTEHGFIEMKQNTKNIFKGKMQSLCPDQVLFPLFNSETLAFKDEKTTGITISAGIFTKGLVGAYGLAIEDFDNEQLAFQLLKIDNEKTSGLFIDTIHYNNRPLKRLPCDYVISGQRYWCEKN